jgi:hypothetical protein
MADRCDNCDGAGIVPLPHNEYDPRPSDACSACGGTGKARERVVSCEEQLAGAVEAFARERQDVLNCVNLYGDETLHKALDGIGWPADYLGGK